MKFTMNDLNHHHVASQYFFIIFLTFFPSTSTIFTFTCVVGLTLVFKLKYLFLNFFFEYQLIIYRKRAIGYPSIERRISNKYMHIHANFDCQKRVPTGI